MGRNILGGFFGHAVFDVHADFVGDGRVLDEFPRGEVTATWAGCVGSMREVGVEALVHRLVLVLRVFGQVMPEVPFAEMSGRIARFLKGLGQGKVIWFQARQAIRDEETGARPAFDELLIEDDFIEVADGGSDPGARRVLTHENTGTRRRTKRAGRIGLREARPPLGQAINIRGLVKRTPKATQVSGPKVIGEDEDDVRLARFRRDEYQRCEQ